MEKEITDLFRYKNYLELDNRERELLNDLCESEEEFEQMKNLFDGIELIKNEKLRPSAKTKSSLDSMFADIHRKDNKVFWYNGTLTMLYPKDKPLQRRPIMQIAAAVVLVIIAIPFLNNDKIDEVKPQLAKVETIQKETESTKNASNSVNSIEKNPGVDTQENITSLTASTVLISKDKNETETTIIESVDVPVSMSMASQPELSVVATDELFDHPDGVFEGTEVSFSRSAGQQTGILDLLTAAF